jgi:mRNA-degrading endonuclease RelE of RelBE toxin-antitoxin system
MTTKDIKSEIRKSLDKVPESVLQDVLDYLKQVENQPIEKVNLTRNLRDILTEDKELLERLAK